MKGMSSHAILAPERSPLTYDRLCTQIEYVLAFLNDHGLGNGNRVAAIVPNGPEMAALFLSIATGSAFVPLAPSYTEQEFDTHFSDLKVSALVVASDSNLQARSVAVRKKIPVIEMKPLKGEAAGLFDLKWGFGDKPSPVQKGFGRPQDVALVLATSGTSSRAKAVLLTQENVFASAWIIASALELTATDRCLNMMPMYHIAGLVSPVLASIVAGGSVLCAYESTHSDFEEWLRYFTPTWYSAVPAIHQAIVDRADQAGWDFRGSSLRFVRSTSSTLFEPLFLRLEQLFGVPVIQSYGLTEALPISSTPLNQYLRNPTSVGIPVSDINIVDDHGLRLGYGEAGEILVRGPQVFSGYEGYPEASESVFSEGWFKTGDVGYLDDDNYLYITGRLKEMINRGGQKVSPYEVEAALMNHSAVQDVAVFSIPHGRLGEAVVAAVVPKVMARLSEAELQRHAAEHLAHYKIPQQIIITDCIPKRSTGKFVRNNLSEHFVQFLNPAYASPVTETEETIAAILSKVLRIESVGRNDNFFSLGGDSIAVIDVLAHLEKAFGVVFTSSIIYRAPTVKSLAEEVQSYRLSESPSWLAPLNTGGSRPLLVCVPPITGDILVYHQLVRYLDPDQPVCGLVSYGTVLKSSMEETAKQYLAEILEKTNGDVFLLLGFSSGGLMAFEIARQLHMEGKDVPFLGILDTCCLYYAHERLRNSALRRIASSVKNLPYWMYYYLPFWLRHYYNKAAARAGAGPGPGALCSERRETESTDRLQKVIDWLRRQTLQRFPARVFFYRAKAQGLFLSSPDMGWGCFAETVSVRQVPGSHTDIVREPYVRSLARSINEDLREAISQSGTARGLQVRDSREEMLAERHTLSS
jgi:acyl-CoA synthetase (AMP-forming)/AMP-acid ligase II/thioesterase domain-containing protein/acyl carrier protein